MFLKFCSKPCFTVNGNMNLIKPNQAVFFLFISKFKHTSNVMGLGIKRISFAQATERYEENEGTKGMNNKWKR